MDINDDSGRLWPLSSDYNNTHKMVSYPPRDKFKNNLGKTESKKLKTCLIQNPMPDKGRNYIAKYHGFTKE